MKNLLGTSTLSPVDVSMMLAAGKIPHQLIGGKTKNILKEGVFIFVSGATFELFLPSLVGRQGAVILVDIELEIQRWSQLVWLEKEFVITTESLSHYLSQNVSKILPYKRLKKPEVILDILATSDQGILKPLMTFVYAIKDSKIRDKIKSEIFLWLNSPLPPTKLLSNILSTCKITYANNKINSLYPELQAAFESEKLLQMKKAVQYVIKNKAVNIKEVSINFQVEEFELQYIVKSILSIQNKE